MPNAPTNTVIATDQAVFTQEIGAEGRRPRIALVTRLANDEFNGAFVLARLADYLRGVVNGMYPGQKLHSGVLIILASPSGDAMDPGAALPSASAPRGPARAISQPRTARQRIEEIIETTRAAYYRVAIGASNATLEELPQVCLYDCSDDERASAFLFGLPAIIEYPMHTLSTDLVATAWQSLGGENFVIHAGQAGNLQPQHCERLFRALVSFLDRTEVLEGVDLSEEEDDTHHFGVHQTLPLLTSASGFFVSRLEVGRWVRAGESVGMVYDRFLGVLSAEIKAPATGLVSALRRYPLLQEGDLVAQIQTHEAITETPASQAYRQ